MPLSAWTGYFGLLTGAFGVLIYLWAMVAFLSHGEGAPTYEFRSGSSRIPSITLLRIEMYLSTSLVTAREASANAEDCYVSANLAFNSGSARSFQNSGEMPPLDIPP